MKVIVCGGRDYRDAEKVFNTLDEYFYRCDEHHPLTIIHGDAAGADTIADVWARTAHYRLGREFSDVLPLPVPAQWRTAAKGYNPRAGTERNLRMLEMKPDLVIAFPGGSGTRHMVSIARQAGVEVMEVE